MYIAAVIYTISVFGPMAMQSIGAGISAAIYFWFVRKELGHEWTRIRNLPLFWPTIAVAVTSIGSLIWASASGLEFYGMRPLIHWGRDTAKIWHIFHPLVLAALFLRLSEEQRHRLVKFWFGLGVASACLGILQHYIPVYHPLPIPDPGLSGLYHATGMTGFHLSYTGIIGFPMGVSLALVAILSRRFRIREPIAIFSVASTILFLIAIIFSYSKVSWIAAPLTALFIALIGFKGRARLALITIVVALSLGWALAPQTRQRFGGTDSIKERVEVWGANIEMIRQHPILGVGWHQNSELSYAYYDAKGIKGFASHAHNNILDQMATTGILGLLAMFWWNAIAIIMAYKIYVKNQNLWKRAFALGLLGGWFCLHITGLTQTNFWDAKILHQIAWITGMTLALL